MSSGYEISGKAPSWGFLKSSSLIKLTRKHQGYRSIDSSGSKQRNATMAQSVYRWATGWTIGVLGFDSRRETGNFSLHHRVQNGSEAHPASYPMGTRVSFPGDKAAGA
jgi:hypothetical protein